MRGRIGTLVAPVVILVLAAVVSAALRSAGHEVPPGQLAQAGATSGGLSTPGGGARPDDEAGPERPNVVLVMTDDMRADDLAHMPLTKSLLAREGMSFTDAVSPHPLCCPARAELVTGQYAQNNGVQHNKGAHGGFAALDPTKEISSWFRDAGYQTGFVGKFLNGYGPHEVRPAGWTWWDALVQGTYDYFDFSFSDNDDSPAVYRNGYVTDAIGQRTDDLVRRFSADDRPFLIYAFHLAPHYRLDGGRKTDPPAAEQDKGTFLDAMPPSLDDPAFNEADVSDQPRPFRHRRRADVDAVVSEHRARLRSLQAVDRSVASLVQTLRETGELDHTFIGFTSDNGYSLGEHRFIGKNVLTRQALRVPLLLRGPGIVPGSTSTLPATLVDVPATFADLAGVTPAWMPDGVSLAPALRGEAQPFRDTTLVQTGTDEDDGWAYRGVRTERYLYGVNGADVFLYDEQRDPDELQNVVDDPAYARVRAQLDQRRAQLAACAGWTCNQQFGLLPEPGR